MLVIKKITTQPQSSKDLMIACKTSNQQGWTITRVHSWHFRMEYMRNEFTNSWSPHGEPGNEHQNEAPCLNFMFQLNGPRPILVLLMDNRLLNM